ncbi:MAG: NAD(P)/FAD-dependent oxidoreductase [Anaerolineae bacterium]|nr:NAD(P)/FAD-dependent oxidoreductase [Anaerolineae bacterium]
MRKKTILIIGGGVAGLAAGIYAQKNGYQSQIFEMHFLPGGLCTSWRRRDYLFDGSIRFLSGTSPNAAAYQLWKELGALEGREVYYYDELTRFEDRDGRAFSLYTNIDRLEAHMLELSPQDQAVTRELCEALRGFTRLDLPVDLTLTEPEEGLEMGQRVMPALFHLLRWQNVSIPAFAARFKDPLLKEALPQFFQFSPPDFPIIMMMMTLAQMHNRESGYPIGGSLAFAEGLAKKYEELGGQIHYKSRVSRILVEEDKATGVRLANGSEHRSDIVISAADGYATIFHLLGGRYADNTIRKYYAELPVAKPILQISLGVGQDFSQEPASLNFPLRRPFMLGNIAHERLVLKHYCFDPNMAPAGKSALTLWCEADDYHWRRLYFDPQAYEEAKQEAASLVLRGLEERYPGLSQHVEVIDVATPVTYERYTANWRGSINGWALSQRKLNMMMGAGMKKTLPGLENFYRIGHWVEPGGNVELSCASGRDVIKDLCKMEDRPFKG